jgi:hypothetical protein
MKYRKPLKSSTAQRNPGKGGHIKTSEKSKEAMIGQEGVHQNQNIRCEEAREFRYHDKMSSGNVTTPELGSRTEWGWALRVLKRMKVGKDGHDDAVRLPMNLRVSTVSIKTVIGAGMHTAKGGHQQCQRWAVVSKGELCNITAPQLWHYDH